MSLPNGYILENVNIATLSVFDLLKHTQDSNFMDRKDFGNIYPLSLELNTGFFTKNDETVESPHVSVNQGDNTIISVCSCNNSSEKLCEHQAEVIYCILEKRDFRIFYDKQLRHKILLQSARGYGLENEADLDVYFLLRYEDGKLHVEKKVKELLSFDGYAIENNLIPKQRSVLVKKIEEKKQLLVISRHRYYNQLNFLLMESACTKSGKIKNPLTNIDPLQAIWKSDHALEVKFYTAILAFQNKYSEDNFEIDHEALKAIVANPLGLPIYYHDRDISETISAKSLLPVAIGMLKAEIQLTVFKKEPFYEITGELIFQDVAIPFKNITLRYDYFVYHHQAFYLVDNPDMLRLIKFFKANHEILLIHASKYEEFIQTTLASLEEFVHINYTYIHTATSVQLEEKEWAIQPIIYLQQQGSFIYITPVMQYGVIEVPVYSKNNFLTGIGMVMNLR